MQVSGYWFGVTSVLTSTSGADTLWACRRLTFSSQESLKLNCAKKCKVTGSTHTGVLDRSDQFRKLLLLQHVIQNQQVM